MINKIKNILLIFLLLVLHSCSVQFKINTEADTDFKENSFKIIVENTKQNDYIGWWVYGQGIHIFKDEQTLQEWALIFPHEKITDIVSLYLAITEMEYFPIECNMIGHLKEDTLVISDFEITYVQGCGEE